MNLWVFFISVFHFTSNTKGSRGTDGADTTLPRHTSALPGGSMVAILAFQYLQTDCVGLGWDVMYQVMFVCTKTFVPLFSYQNTGYKGGGR